MKNKPLVNATCKLGTKGCFEDGRCHTLVNCENKITTNADKIRAMSDEELAEFIKRAASNCLVDLMYGVCKNQHCCSVCRASHPSVKEWLQSEAE